MAALSAFALRSTGQLAELKHEIGASLQVHFPARQIARHGSPPPFRRFYKRRRDPENYSGVLAWKKSASDAYYSKLSGDKKQRLALAMALVNDRAALFDEPTAGLDPKSARKSTTFIEELRREKKNHLMTTHYIEEAERLCDRVAIVDHGKVIACGSPRELKQRSAGNTRIEVKLARPAATDAGATSMA